MTLSLLLSGCVSDTLSPCGGDPSDISKDRVMLVMNIMPMNTRGSSAGQENEMINSLRIVVLDVTGMEISDDSDYDGKTSSSGIIECNHYVEFSGNIPASSLSYFYTWPTTVGKKKIFVFANEKSVGEISYQTADGVELPLPVESMPKSLSNLLNMEILGGDEGLSSVFLDVIHSVYFSPVYSPLNDTDNPYDDGIYALPYTTESDVIDAFKGMGWVGDKPAQTPNVNLFLIPVATKFTFNFTNEREMPVDISEISISKIDSQNFLMATVGESDYNKTLNNQPTYWVDWLAVVSRLSHDNGGLPNNSSFNSLYGWISDYTVPETSQSNQISFFELLKEFQDNEDQSERVDNSDIENPDFHWYTIPPAENKVKGNLSFGPFYVPESCNIVTFTYPGTDIEPLTKQTYYLTLSLSDSNGIGPDFNNVAIDNLEALFRNTSVIINVNITGKSIEIYAQIEDWKEKSASGWIIEGK